jgi:hypothetical protein
MNSLTIFVSRLRGGNEKARRFQNSHPFTGPVFISMTTCITTLLVANISTVAVPENIKLAMGTVQM